MEITIDITDEQAAAFREECIDYSKRVFYKKLSREVIEAKDEGIFFKKITKVFEKFFNNDMTKFYFEKYVVYLLSDYQEPLDFYADTVLDPVWELFPEIAKEVDELNARFEQKRLEEVGDPKEAIFVGIPKHKLEEVKKLLAENNIRTVPYEEARK